MKKTVVNQILLLGVLPLFWGSTFLATKICLIDLPPIWAGAIRYIISSFIFLVMMLKESSVKKSIQELKAHWHLFLAVGIVGTFFAAFFQNLGLRFTTASASSLLNTLEPVMVAILSFLILKDRLPWASVMGLVIAFVGGYILITNGKPASILHLDGTIRGNVFIFFSILSYAFYTIFTKMLVSRTEPIYAVTFSSIIGTLMLIFSALVMDELPVLSQVSLQTWMAIVYLAIFPTCIALFLFNQLLTRVAASRISIILFLIPIYGLILGIVILGEPFTLAMAVGGGITMVGIWFIEYGPTKIKSRGIRTAKQ